LRDERLCGRLETAWLAENRTFLLVGSFVLLFVAVYLNIIGLHIGKWLQNAGGVGTYVPLMMWSVWHCFCGRGKVQ